MSKLCDLIELGSVLIGEAHSFYWNRERNCGCVLGAAYAAVSTLPTASDLYASDIYLKLGSLVDAASLVVPCPVCGPVCAPTSYWGYYLKFPLLLIADHLHSHHFWSRHKIADWLRPIEEKFEAERPKVVAEEPCVALDDILTPV